MVMLRHMISTVSRGAAIGARMHCEALERDLKERNKHKS